MAEVPLEQTKQAERFKKKRGIDRDAGRFKNIDIHRADFDILDAAASQCLERSLVGPGLAV